MNKMSLPINQSNQAAAGNSAPLKLALVSTGLGHINRGFEISTARWFDALQRHSTLDVRLFSGGEHPGAKALWNFPRSSIWTKPIQYIPFMSEQHRWEFTYGVEQVSFWSALNFELINWKPDAVWVKDVPLAHMLLASRVAFNLKFKIILANGGMFKPKTYECFDLTQQLQHQAFDEAIEYGIPAEKMEILGNCVPAPSAVLADERALVRQSLGLNESDYVIVCVAAWNKYHKRIDYLLNEVANLTDPNIKLLLCGAPEVDTHELQEQGKALLGDRVQWLTVEPEKVASILQASDVFVLPSLRESFGNVLLEAALCGLPVVTHPHDGAQFVIADDFWMTDLTEPGSLTKRLGWLKDNAATIEGHVQQLKDSVNKRFSEESLVRQFQQMVRRTVYSNPSRIAVGASQLD
ncbi:MAG: glycosyltransferase family 4 protein [Candidatus Obscuribacterales bacterium]|jgi:glycosyltransferase involved in cell wall biosynthesis